MNQERRVNPDDLLADIEAENRGQLTVFLGAAAGVGKTFEMLQAARERLAEGTDLVVGWVEPHDRPDTIALLEGLPQIAPRMIEYRDKSLKEMDLDGILARAPKLVLVDELAHTNAPGSRHLKRHQDVEELLTSGIDVYSTLNIQHLESLKDVVAQITGVDVRETVPDQVLEKARIQLVDIAPEQLIQRLKEGKIYLPAVAERALGKFFRPGNIDALRELSMRYAAQRVDRQMESYRRVHGIVDAWPAGERVMVCVSASPFSEQLVRIGRRMAAGLKADLLVVYAETPAALRATEADKDQLARTMHLAQQMGADVITVSGNDAVEELLEVARKRNVTHVIIGKPLHSGWFSRFRASVVDKVLRQSRDISVHVIPGDFGAPKVGHGSAVRHEGNAVAPYVQIMAIMIFVTISGWLWRSAFGEVNMALLYLLPVLYGAARWGLQPGIAAAIVGFLAYDVFSVSTRLSAAVVDVRYLISFAFFVLLGVLIGILSDRLRQQIAGSRVREAQTAILYGLSREITAVADIDPVLTSVVRKVSETVGGQVAVLLPDPDGQIRLRACSVAEEDCFLDEAERAVASWVFGHGQPAGRGTDTLGGATAYYLPMSAEQGPAGVLGVRFTNAEDYRRSDAKRLLEALANLSAMAVTRLSLVEKAREASALGESEKLSTALLNSISHDLRTPLASMIGAVTSLLEDEGIYDAAARQDLLRTLKQGAMRMNRLVNNLLDMARLESGMVKLNRQWCDVEDVIGGAMRRVGDPIRTHPVRMDIKRNLPLVKADCALIEQVITNLLDNAIKYSEAKGRITIAVKSSTEELEVSVSNQGSRIPPADLKRIFDKFYRVIATGYNGGTGLGLAVSKGIIDVHGGRIWAESGGEDVVTVAFVLPLDGDVPSEPPIVTRGDNPDGR